MAIKPTCDFCVEELTEFGGLLFSPPDDSGYARKWHICKKCYEKLIKTGSVR
jgi:hypothetical protein